MYCQLKSVRAKLEENIISEIIISKQELTKRKKPQYFRIKASSLLFAVRRGIEPLLLR